MGTDGNGDASNFVLWELKGTGTQNDPNTGTEGNGNMKRKNARKREAIFRLRSLPISVRENVAKALKGHEKVSRVTTRKLKNVPCLRVPLGKRPVHKTKK